MADPFNDPFKGTWHYRSFLNDPGNTQPNDHRQAPAGVVVSFYAVRQS